MIEIWVEDIPSGSEQSYDTNEGNGYPRDEACDRCIWLNRKMQLPGKLFFTKDQNPPLIKEDVPVFTMKIHPEYRQEFYDDSEEASLIGDDDDDDEEDTEDW